MKKQLCSLALATCILTSCTEINFLKQKSQLEISRSYGEIIYNSNNDSENQIYIIGISHRDAFTRKNGNLTAESQKEIYQLGKSLIKNNKLELLFPEGFFSSQQNDIIKENYFNEFLESRLKNDNLFLNAEMLLIENTGIRTKQIEDLNLYNKAVEQLKSLEDSKDPYQYIFEKGKMEYLQKMRTAVMINEIPIILDKEFKEGRIKSKKALFTIGLSHIPDIIQFLKEEKINVDSPAFTSFEDYQSDLNFSKEDYKITVIIPNTLRNKYEEILRESG